MKVGNAAGFALLLVLLLSLALFTVVSLAMTANYRLHLDNKARLRDLLLRSADAHGAPPKASVQGGGMR